MIGLLGFLSYYVRTNLIEKMSRQYYPDYAQIDTRYAPNLYGGYNFDTDSLLQGMNPIGIQYGPIIPVLWGILLVITNYMKPTDLPFILDATIIVLTYAVISIWVIGTVVRINLRRITKPEIIGRFYYMYNVNSRRWLDYCRTLVIGDSVAIALTGVVILLLASLF